MLIGIVGPSAVRALARRVLTIRQILRQEPLDLVVLIDNPGLNFHFARVASRPGVAWSITSRRSSGRGGRAACGGSSVAWTTWCHPAVRGSCTAAPAFPARSSGIRCWMRWRRPTIGPPAGHLRPAARGVRDRPPAGEPRRRSPRAPAGHAGGVRLLQGQGRSLKAILAVAETVDPDEIKRRCDGAGLDVRLVARDPNGVMAAADLLFIASGTASLQAAIIGTPMVIVYRCPGSLPARASAGPGPQHRSRQPRRRPDVHSGTHPASRHAGPSGRSGAANPRRRVLSRSDAGRDGPRAGLARDARSVWPRGGCGARAASPPGGERAMKLYIRLLQYLRPYWVRLMAAAVFRAAGCLYRRLCLARASRSRRDLHQQEPTWLISCRWR